MTGAVAAKAAYDSAWHHPGMAWLAGALLLACGLVGWGRGWLRQRAWAWCFVLLQAEIIVDAWFTGALSPLRPGAASTAAAVIFVILGDLRYFYLVERQRAGMVTTRTRALVVALSVSLIMPVVTAVLSRVNPSRYSGNLLYLAYELGLFVLVLAFTLARRRAVSDAGAARYLRRLLVLELVQYGLWGLADTLIVFGGGDLVALGWWLRLMPNALYYVAFAPVATWATPMGARA